MDLLTPQRPQQNRKICPVVGLPENQRLHGDYLFLTPLMRNLPNASVRSR